MAVMGAVFTVVILLALFPSGLKAFIATCENENVTKIAKPLTTDVLQVIFCAEIRPQPDPYAKIFDEGKSCPMHRFCAGHYMWWWVPAKHGSDIYNIYVQLRRFRNHRGGEFPVTLFTNGYSESLKLTVIISGKADVKTETPKTTQETPPIQCEDAEAEAESAASGSTKCPSGWVPVGGDMCVLNRLEDSEHYSLARERCAMFGASLVKLSRSEDRRKRRKRFVERDEDEEGGDDADEDGEGDDDAEDGEKDINHDGDGEGDNDEEDGEGDEDGEEYRSWRVHKDDNGDNNAIDNDEHVLSNYEAARDEGTNKEDQDSDIILIDKISQGIVEIHRYTISKCLNARLHSLSGSERVWVMDDQDESSCLGYNSDTKIVQEERSCHNSRKFTCMLDTGQYKNPWITDFHVQLHDSAGEYKHVSINVTQSTYHKVKVGVRTATISCEADGWPKPEVVITDFSHPPTLHTSPYRYDMSGKEGVFLGSFTCIASNIFGEQVNSKDLQLWREEVPKQRKKASLLKFGIHVFVFLVLFWACLAVFDKFNIWKRLSKFFKQKRRPPPGSARVSTADYLLPLEETDEDDVWSENVPLQVH